MPHDWETIEHGEAGTTWLLKGQARLNAVFVHGFQGNHLKTWTHHGNLLLALLGRRQSVSLFDLLMSDETLSCNYFSVGHKGGIRSPTDLESAGGRVRTFLRNNVLANGLPIALVAHSFGGLACRLAILSMLEELGEKLPVVALLMMGTPNSGTEIARAATALGSGAALDMMPFDDRLAHLNREWTAHVVNGGHPDESPEARAPIVCWAAVGTEDAVVPRSSAAALASFSQVEYLNKGHKALVKAGNRADETYQLIARFLGEAEKAVTRRPIEIALQQLTHRFRAASLRSRWVRREREELRLEPTGDPDIFTCRMRNQRWGGLAQQTLRLSVWVSGHKRSDVLSDYDWEIGRGVLGEAEFGQLTGHPDWLERYFRMENVSVSQSGEHGDYVLEDRQDGTGWTILQYRAPAFLAEGRPCESLSLEFRSSVDRRQGWMYYSVARTVIEHLDVVFSAPFSYGVIPRLGRGQQFEIPNRIGSEFVSRIQRAGPVSLGRNVIWVYDHEPFARGPHVAEEEADGRLA